MRGWSEEGRSAGLAVLGRRLEAWRQVHGGRGRRLPEDVWEGAVRFARSGDPAAVAQALRLNPKTLTQRMACAEAGGGVATRPGRQAFVEVAPIAAPGACGGCRIEVSAAGGSRVSIELADQTGVDLVAVAAGLLRAAQ